MCVEKIQYILYEAYCIVQNEPHSQFRKHCDQPLSLKIR